MPYLYLLIGIVDLILVFINRDWGFTLVVVLGIIYVIFGLYEVFMPRKQFGIIIFIRYTTKPYIGGVLLFNPPSL